MEDGKGSSVDNVLTPHNVLMLHKSKVSDTKASVSDPDAVMLPLSIPPVSTPKRYLHVANI